MLGGRTTSTARDTFRSLGCMGTPYLEFANLDASNDNCPSFYIRQPYNKCTPNNRGPSLWLGFDNYADKFQWGGTENEAKNWKFQWTIYPVAGKHDVKAGYAKIFVNLSGTHDPGFQIKGNEVFVDTSSGGWGYYGQFRFYYGIPTNYDTIGADFTVQTGQSLNIDNNLFLPNGIRSP